MTRVRLIFAALALAAIVVLLFVSHRGSNQPGGAINQPVPAATSVAVTSPTPAEEDHDDGAVDPSDRPAVIAAGPTDPKEAAIQVVVKLLNTIGRSDEQWRAGLRPYVSDALFAELADADPTSVPAGRVDDGRVKAASAGDELVQVSVPVVGSGDSPRPVATIRVTLSGTSHRWVATELDVERA